MARITVEDCIDKFESRFELVLVASNRARKLHSGENPTVERDNDKNTVISLREIAEETIPIDDMKNKLIEEYQTVSEQNDEDLSLEQIDSENINEISNEDHVSTEEQDASKINIDDNDDQVEDIESTDNFNEESPEENS
tara:strand:- start:1126 stop:1542 length:417 start_codon:yes stop_codon:yes gene_type:complete